MISRSIMPVLILLTWSGTVSAQQATETSPGYASRVGIAMHTPGPLLVAAGTSRFDLYSLSTSSEYSPPAAMQAGWRRTDYELGRAWLGSVFGFFGAWIADMVIHHEFDFSKANWLWNEQTSGKSNQFSDKVQNGEVVYNVLLYCGLTPFYAKRGMQLASPVKGNGLMTYLCSLTGSLIGMYYWTQLDELYDIRGFAAFTGLSTLGAFLGNRIFK